MSFLFKTDNVKSLYENYTRNLKNYQFFDDFKMAYCLIDPNDTIFLAIQNKKIVGVCALHQENKQKFKNLFLEILPEFRGQHLSKKLLEMQYEYIGARNGYLIETNYSKMGEERVKKYRWQLSREFKVRLLS